MHRGSSKGTGTEPVPETLPLSAPPPSRVEVELELVRGGRSERRRLSVPGGTTVRAVLRLVGVSPEGCAVLDGEDPLPADEPIEHDRQLLVVPTFSGG